MQGHSSNIYGAPNVCRGISRHGCRTKTETSQLTELTVLWEWENREVNMYSEVWWWVLWIGNKATWGEGCEGYYFSLGGQGSFEKVAWAENKIKHGYFLAMMEYHVRRTLPLKPNGKKNTTHTHKYKIESIWRHQRGFKAAGIPEKREAHSAGEARRLRKQPQHRLRGWEPKLSHGAGMEVELGTTGGKQDLRDQNSGKNEKALRSPALCSDCPLGSVMGLDKQTPLLGPR